MSKNIFFTQFSEISGSRLDPLYYKLDKKYNLKTIKLKDLLLDIFQGQAQGYENKDNIKILKVKNLDLFGNINFDDVTYINTVSKKKTLQFGDIITPFRGQTIFTKKFAFFDSSEIVTIDNNLGVIRLDNTKILPKYFYYYISSNIGFHEILKNLGGAGIPALTKDIIYNVDVYVPSIKIQNKIISIMDNANKEKKRKDDESKNKLKSIDMYLLNELALNIPSSDKVDLKDKVFFRRYSEISGDRLDPTFYKTEFKNLITNIKQQNYTSIKDIARFSSETWNQKSDFIDKFPYVEISEIDIVTGAINNINYVEIDKAPSRAKMIARNNDIIVSTTRPNRGAIALVKTDSILIVSTGFSIIRDVNKNIEKEFLFILLKSSIVLNQFHQRSSGGNYPAITQEEIAKVIIPLPTIDIQNKIIARMKIIKNEAQILKDEANKIYVDSKKEVEDIILGESNEI
jgi:type I restriction enzyme S subunit